MSNKMVVIPLIIMFILTIGSMGLGTVPHDPFMDAEDEIVVEREIEEGAVDNFYEDLEEDWYDEWESELPLSSWWSPGYYSMAHEELKDLLDEHFGYDEKHSYVAEELLEEINDHYEDKEELLPIEDVGYLVGLDPGWVEEAKELHGFGFALDDEMLWVGLFISFIGLVLLLGVRVLGIGVSEVSVLLTFKLFGFMTLWILMSIAARDIITAIPVLGPTVWGILTLVYAVGVFMQGAI